MHIEKNHLGIGKLPKQEVGKSHFTASPDQKIWIRNTRRVEMRANEFCSHVLRTQAAGFDSFRDPAAGRSGR